MRILNRKSQMQRLLETVNDLLDGPGGIRSSLPGGIKSSLPGVGPRSKALKTGMLAAGGLAGLTAGSAGISSLRRRKEGARDDS